MVTNNEDTLIRYRLQPQNALQEGRAAYSLPKL